MTVLPVSILYKSTAGRYRPVRVADGPITASCRFIKNSSWAVCNAVWCFLTVIRFLGRAVFSVFYTSVL